MPRISCTGTCAVRVHPVFGRPGNHISIIQHDPGARRGANSARSVTPDGGEPRRQPTGTWHSWCLRTGVRSSHRPVPGRTLRPCCPSGFMCQIPALRTLCGELAADDIITPLGPPRTNPRALRPRVAVARADEARAAPRRTGGPRAACPLTQVTTGPSTHRT